MKEVNKNYYMPAQWEEHEGTWLTWPHRFSFRGEHYRAELDGIWTAMALNLHKGENVHIIVYDEEEKKHVEELLGKADADMKKINFAIIVNDDVWIRDNGPIFVHDEEGNVVLTNWKFNGWGAKYDYQLDNMVPERMSEICGFTKIDLPMVLEGGSIDVNGTGSLMAAKTSILYENRNPQFSQEEQEKILSQYLGADNFIWISGLLGEENGDEDTDFHIDGSARFTSKNTIVYEWDPYMEDKSYLLEAYETHYQEIKSCRAEDGEELKLIPLPLTRKIVEEAECKGSYLNFYIGNKVVLVPTYADENDELAMRILEGQFPGREIVGINVNKLYPYGGMINCVTKQQPKRK